MLTPAEVLELHEQWTHESPDTDTLDIVSTHDFQRKYAAD